MPQIGFGFRNKGRRGQGARRVKQAKPLKFKKAKPPKRFM